MASASGSSSGGGVEYRVKLAKKTDGCAKKYHVMRFKPPHKCDLEKLVNPTLDRQVKNKTAEEAEEIPESGEGSEYGRKRREEARRRRRGYNRREADPDDNPWVLREKRKGGKHFVGRKEGTVSSASSYFMFTVGQDGVFEVHPVENWYDFVPPVKYNYLDADEAELKFEKRNNTLNYFSIMLNKKMRNLEDGEADLGGLEGKQGGGKRKEKKKMSAESGLLLTDSDSGGFSSQNDTGDSSDDRPSRKRDKKTTKKKKKKGEESDNEAGEDTDEGEMESREVDYMSDSSSNSEIEFLAKKANKEVPKDDEEIERKEDGDIAFVDSSSSDEEELTEKGKELKELIKKLSGNKASSSEEEGGSGMEFEEEMERKDKSGSNKKSTKDSRKRERESHDLKGGVTTTKSEATPPKRGGASDRAQSPPGKKPKLEISTTSISEEEVKRYLQRRPITSKDLVKKFTSKKSDMDRNRIVEVLHQIIAGLKNVEKQTRKGKLYLSLKPEDE